MSLSLPLIPWDCAQWCCCGILFYLCTITQYTGVGPCNLSLFLQLWQDKFIKLEYKHFYFQKLLKHSSKHRLCVGNMYPFKGWPLLYLLHSNLYDDLFLPLNWDWNVFHVNRVSLHSQRVYTEHHTCTHISLCVSLIPTSATLLDLLPQI